MEVFVPVIPDIDFEKFLDVAQSCDVVLFAGTSDASEAVEWLTLGKYSHAAMVAVGPDGRKFLFQAASEALGLDPIKGIKHTGAQLGDLRATMLQVVNGYHDAPTYRRLDLDRPADFDQQVWEAIAAVDGRPFPSLIEMAREYTSGLMHIAMTNGPMFCSELVADVFQRVGLIDHTYPANAYCPTDFSSERNGVVLQTGSFVVDQNIIVPSGD